MAIEARCILNGDPDILMLMAEIHTAERKINEKIHEIKPGMDQKAKVMIGRFE